MPTLDMLEAQKQVKRVTHYLEQRVDTLRDSLDMRDKTLNLAFQFKDWRRDVKTVRGHFSHAFDVSFNEETDYCLQGIEY